VIHPTSNVDRWIDPFSHRYSLLSRCGTLHIIYRNDHVLFLFPLSVRCVLTITLSLSCCIRSFKRCRTVMLSFNFICFSVIHSANCPYRQLFNILRSSVVSRLYGVLMLILPTLDCSRTLSLELKTSSDALFQSLSRTLPQHFGYR
jgi:hypothetical protein